MHVLCAVAGVFGGVEGGAQFRETIHGTALPREQTRGSSSPLERGSEEEPSSGAPTDPDAPRERQEGPVHKRGVLHQDRGREQGRERGVAQVLVGACGEAGVYVAVEVAEG